MDAGFMAVAAGRQRHLGFAALEPRIIFVINGLRGFPFAPARDSLEPARPARRVSGCEGG